MKIQKKMLTHHSPVSGAHNPSIFCVHCFIQFFLLLWIFSKCMLCTQIISQNAGCTKTKGDIIKETLSFEQMKPGHVEICTFLKRKNDLLGVTISEVQSPFWQGQCSITSGIGSWLVKSIITQETETESSMVGSQIYEYEYE